MFIVTFLLGMLAQEIYHVKAVKTIQKEMPTIEQRIDHILNH
jgi:hypothetical protein